MFYEEMPLGKLFEKRTAEFGDKTYLIYGGKEYSYKAMNEKISQVASALLRAGVKKGMTVNLHLGNCPEFLFTFFAAARIGAVLTPSNLLLTQREASYVINHCEAVITVTQPSFLELIKSIKPECSNLKQIVVVGGEKSEGDVITWNDFVSGASTEVDAKIKEVPQADDVFVTMYTSGTTAMPKGVMLTHQNIISAGHSWMWLTGFTPKDRTMTGWPLFHANALFFNVVGSLVNGASILLLDKLSPSNILRDATQHNVTHFNFTSAGMNLMMSQPEDPSDALNTVRVIHSAGGPTELVEKWMNRFKIKVVMIYNLTECALAAGSPISGPRPIKYGSIGYAAPSLPYPTELRVVDENGIDTPPGVQREIIVKGPALMKGYFKDPEKTAETVRNGWLYTGDGGMRDEDGCFWFQDRLKDMLKPKGENVASVEVESVIVDHPKVADVGVIGVMDPIYGEEIKASIVLKEGETSETVNPEELVKWSLERLAKFKVPRYWEYRDTPIPRILGGAKISKKDMRKEKQDNPTAGCYDAKTKKWNK